MEKIQSFVQKKALYGGSEFAFPHYSLDVRFDSGSVNRLDFRSESSWNSSSNSRSLARSDLTEISFWFDSKYSYNFVVRLQVLRTEALYLSFGHNEMTGKGTNDKSSTVIDTPWGSFRYFSKHWLHCHTEIKRQKVKKRTLNVFWKRKA